MDNEFVPVDPVDAPVEDAPATPPTTSRGRGLRAAALGSIVAGGLGVAAIVGPLAAQAASPSPSASTAPASSGQPACIPGGGPRGLGGPGGGLRFNPNEAVSDASVVAKAIGISEADLTTALTGGQTLAAVAKAHNVDVQKVIDALVQDGLDEIAADVKAGTITQAQADARTAEVTQRVTDQVNGTFTGRGPGHDGGHDGGPGGPGGPGHDGGPEGPGHEGAPAASAAPTATP
jgi:hypothetical protein